MSALHHLQQLQRTNPSLDSLDLSGHAISEIDSLLSVLSWFPRLKTLDLSQNNISSLPSDMSSLLSLRTLDLSHNPISVVDNIITGLESLRRLRHLFITLPTEEMEDEVIVSLIRLRTFNNVQLPEAEESSDEEEQGHSLFPEVTSSHSPPSPQAITPPERPVPGSPLQSPPPLPLNLPPLMNDYELPMLADHFAKVCRLPGAENSPACSDSVFEEHCSAVFKKHASDAGKTNNVASLDALFELSKFDLFSILCDPLLHSLSEVHPSTVNHLQLIFDRMKNSIDSARNVMTTVIPDLYSELNDARDSVKQAERETSDLLHAAELLEEEAKTHSKERQMVASQFEKERWQLREEIGMLKMENEKLKIRVRQLSTSRTHNFYKDKESKPEPRAETSSIKHSNSSDKGAEDLSNARSVLHCLASESQIPKKLMGTKSRSLTLEANIGNY
ncbi:hypothetical protein GEMRC1_009211 [Eukaryota sp. GEM-RC1]